MRIIRLLPILVTAPALLGACSTSSLPLEPHAAATEVTTPAAASARSTCDVVRAVATVQGSPSAQPTRDDARCDQARTRHDGAAPVDPSGRIAARSGSASPGADSVAIVLVPALARHSGVYATSW